MIFLVKAELHNRFSLTWRFMKSQRIAPTSVVLVDVY